MLVSVLALTVSASAQQTPEMVFEPAPGHSPAQASASATGFPRSHIQGDPDPQDPGVGGLGILGRVGHIAGNTIERNQSITYFDLSPYMFSEETYFFGDARLFLTNQGKVGGSTGLGVRQYFPDRDFVFGASAWYDRDDSRRATFEQVGMSLEIFSQWMDVRSNYYTAIGDNVQTLGTTIIPGSAQFVGNNISFSTQTAVSTGADMVDLTFTVPVPGEIAQSVNLEASAGWYQIFTPGQDLKNINGFKLRVDADFLERVVHFYSELTQDSFFDTNIVAGVDVNYWHHLESRPRFGSSQFNRIAQWVRRNRNVVTVDSTVANPPQLAINPNTGDPYFVYHVRNVPSPPPANFPAPDGDGSIDKPFQFLDEAQAAGSADLYYVHADSVYDNRPVVLNAGELVLGEGVLQTISVQGVSQQLQLPRATNGANRPVFQNTVGTAVTLADNNIFAGFDINNTQGTAILGSGINGSKIRDVDITGTVGAGAHGLELQGSTGIITLEGLNITGTEGNAFYVTGGDASVVYNSGTITNASGFAVALENNAGSVNMSGATVIDTGGLGVEILASGSQNTFGDMTLTNTAGNALTIQNSTGLNSFFGNITISGATGDGIFVQNFSGTTKFQNPVIVNNRNGVGVNLQDNSGTIQFLNSLAMNAPTSGGINDHGINYQGSSGQVLFNSISIIGSNGSGINIGGPAAADQNTGRFQVLGPTAISQASLQSILLLNDASNVQFNGVNISERGDRGIEVTNHSGRANFGGTISIANENDVGLAGLLVRNSSGTVQFGNATVSNALGTEPGAWVHDNTGVDTFNSLSVQSTGTTAVEITTNASVNISSGTVDATNARGVTMIDNSAFGVQFDSVSSVASDFGIFVTNDITTLDHPGTFRVTGDGQNPGSGGTINTESVAGASFFNVGIVDLEYIDMAGNANGVLSNDVENLTLLGNSITGSTGIGAGFGVDILDNNIVVMQQNLITDNEGLNQIRIRVDRQLLDANTSDVIPYQVSIVDNVVTDSTNLNNVGFGDMIAISTLATGNGSALSLLVDSNGQTDTGGFVGFSANRRLDDAAFSTVWNGDLTATITGNNTAMSDNSGDVGFRITTTRATSVNNVIYEGNVLNDTAGSGSTGLLFDFTGSTTLSILDNYGMDPAGNRVVDGIVMGTDTTDLQDTAVDLTFRSTNNIVDISRNQITFNATDSTAVLFRTINGPSAVNMDGNTIKLFDDGVFPRERGVVFQTVIGTINLSSVANQDNVIIPTTVGVTTFSIPTNVSTGSLLINGSRVP